MKRSDFFKGVFGEIPTEAENPIPTKSLLVLKFILKMWCLTDLVEPQGAVAVGGFRVSHGTHGFDGWVRVGHKGSWTCTWTHGQKKGFQPPSLSKYQPEKAKKTWNAYTANCKQWCWDPLRHWQAAMNPWRPPEGSHEIPICHSCWFNETLNRVDVDSWFGCVCVCVFHSLSETQVVQEFFSQQYEIFSQQYQYRSKHIVLRLISRWVPQSSDPHPVYAHVMFFSRSLTLSLSLSLYLSLSLHTTATATTTTTTTTKTRHHAPHHGQEQKKQKTKANMTKNNHPVTSTGSWKHSSTTNVKVSARSTLESVGDGKSGRKPTCVNRKKG